MRHLRNPAPLALVSVLAAVLLSACGSGSSSSGPSAGPTNQLEIRPVFARYTPGASLGPTLPQALAAVLAKQTCPTQPKVVSQMLLECDDRNTVFLLKDPIVTGGIQQATATHIGHQKLWFVKVTLTPAAASTLSTATSSMTGSEIAYSLGGKVITTTIVDSNFDPNHLVVLGTFDQAQAQALATQLVKG